VTLDFGPSGKGLREGDAINHKGTRQQNVGEKNRLRGGDRRQGERTSFHKWRKQKGTSFPQSARIQKKVQGAHPGKFRVPTGGKLSLLTSPRTSPRKKLRGGRKKEKARREREQHVSRQPLFHQIPREPWEIIKGLRQGKENRSLWEERGRGGSKVRGGGHLLDRMQDRSRRLRGRKVIKEKKRVGRGGLVQHQQM